MAATAGLRPQSLVSLWRDPHDSGETNFACSGVIVANGLILTVKHAFCEENPPSWVRPYADGAQTYPIVGTPVRHNSLDAALVRIEAMPATAQAAPVDPYGRARPDMRLQLNGYRKGKYECAYETGYMCFEAKERRHVISAKQPPGHSGCGVSHGDQLWGIAFAHYTDGNVHRGCVVSCGQLWDGFLDAHLSLPPAKRINLGEIPSHDVDKLARRIRRLIANNDFQTAKARLLDLADGYGTSKELDEATVISMSVNEVLRQDPGLDPSLAHRKQLAVAVIDLINRIVDRLIGGHDDS